MAGFGANFTVSSAPSVGNYNEPEPEPTVDPVESQLTDLREKLEMQSRESAKKISELVEQNQLLNQSVQDMLQRQQQAAVPPPQSGEQVIPQNDDGTFDWSAYWSEAMGSDPSPEAPQGEDMKPEDINKLVDQRVQEREQNLLSVQQRAQQTEQQLIQQFQTQEKDLHPYSQQVVALWKRQIASMDPRAYQENPEAAMTNVYQTVIDTARELFLAPNAKPAAPPQQQYTGFPGGGQGRGHDAVAPPDPAMAGMELPSDVRTEDRRAADMENYIRERKRAQQQRTGYFAVPGQG